MSEENSFLKSLGNALLDSGQEWASAEIDTEQQKKLAVTTAEPVVLNKQPFVDPVPLGINVNREVLIMGGSAIAIGVLIAILVRG